MKNITPEIQKKTSIFALLFAIGMLLALILAIVWPLLTIWAMNALFKLSISYTFSNWLACVVLIFTLQGALKISRTPIKISKKD
jgi:hypothetical protein